MSQFFKTKEETQAWLDEVGVVSYTINDDLSVDVGISVRVDGNGLTHFPVRFGKVWGFFSCSNNQLTSLEGAPQHVGDFSCSGNHLTSLEGAPKEVRGDFDCSNNLLTTLEGAPQHVEHFDCSNNLLTTLEGAPKEVWKGDLCGDDDGVEVKCDFRCSNNQLTSLEGAPNKIQGVFYCQGNPLRDISAAKYSIDQGRYKGISEQEVCRNMLRDTSTASVVQPPSVRPVRSL